MSIVPPLASTSQRVDRRPERAHVEDLARDRVAAREQRWSGSGLLAEPERECRAGPIDELVGDDGGDDLAPQAVASHPRAVSLRKRWREVALEVVTEVVVLGQVRVEQAREEPDLAVRHHHRQLGRDEPLMVDFAVVDRILAGKELDLAVEPRVLLEMADQTGMYIDHRRRLRQ